MHTRQLRVFAPTPLPPASVIDEICFFVFETRYFLQSKKGRKIEGSCWLFLVRTTATGFSLFFFGLFTENLGLRNFGCSARFGHRACARAHTDIGTQGASADRTTL